LGEFIVLGVVGVASSGKAKKAEEMYHKD